MNLMIWRMAWRNLWRHPQRTFLMIATVALGSWVILVMWGITDGFFSSMTNLQTTQNQGAFQVRAVGYPGDPASSNGLTLQQVVGVVDSGLTRWAIRVYGRIPTSWI